MKYRPWGPIEWALSLTGPRDWNFVGAIGTEERSTACWKLMRNLGLVRGELFAEIHDVDSEKYGAESDALLRERVAAVLGDGGSPESIRRMDLMSESFRIEEFARGAGETKQSVVLDITSLPKRYFFPILRRLVENNTVLDLLVTYTSPSSYASDAPLYEDIEPWGTLPGFGDLEGRPGLWIVSVGFLVESLRRHVGDNPQEKMKVLIPFPAPLSALRRTWKSVADLEQDHSDDRFEKFRVDTLDMSAAFDRIASLAGYPPKSVAFAPFGPKPTSAAMCLYAMQRDSSVHYPQPTVYHPRYSIGIQGDDPAAAVNAYWVKHDGEFLYSV